MATRYTERAQRIILLAQEEAKRLNHDYVGTEHILLGMITINEGRACQVLNNLKADRKRIREEINNLAGPGDNMLLLGDIPFTPKAKKALEYAFEEAQQMGHTYVGSEHFLLGLIREGEGVAARVLEKMGFELEQVRAEVLSVLEGKDGVSRIKEQADREEYYSREEKRSREEPEEN